MHKYLDGSHFFTSVDADKLFVFIRNLPANEQIQSLQFTRDWVEKCWPKPLFEYDTDFNHALYLLGLANEALGLRVEAAQCFKYAIDIWPSDADSYVAYSNLEDNLSAQIAVLEQGLEAVEDPRIRLNLAHAYIEEKLPKQALMHLRKIGTDWKNYSLVMEDLKVAEKLLEAPRKV